MRWLLELTGGLEMGKPSWGMDQGDCQALSQRPSIAGAVDLASAVSACGNDAFETFAIPDTVERVSKTTEE